MRSILILAISGTLLLLPGVSPADTNAECQSACINEKATRDPNCPPPGEDYDSKQESARCLKESQDAYNSCVKSCPPPEPIDKPAEN
jgi:hypothetical protein